MSLTDYEKVKKLGSGGFGDAVLVKLKSDSSQQFVLKEMRFASSDEHHDCVSEVELLRLLGHPHIVQFIGSFSETRVIYLVMEFCAGGDMAQLITKQSKKCYFSEVQIISWTLQILEALEYLHGRSKPVLHRDLKPANIFLTGDFSVKIGDFGISRELAHFQDMATTICGTPLYLSPEVFRQEPYDHKCDIWSLGCCVYEMMTFKTAINPLLLAVLNTLTVSPMPSNYSIGLIDLVKEMLQTDPKARPTAAESAAKLQQLPTWDPNDPSLVYLTEVTPALTSADAAISASAAADDDDDLGDLTLKGLEVVDSINSHQTSLKQDQHQPKDTDKTLKNKGVKLAARVWTPERILKNYGYKFNDAGCLLNIKTGERFKYDVSGDHEIDEKNYQIIAKAVTNHVYDLLEKTLKMQRIFIPLDYKDGEPWSFIYATNDIFTNPDKILILIGGTEPVRAGIWSRKAIINDSIDAGSQIPCIKQAMREGYAVLLLNQNQTYFEVDGFKCRVRENDTPFKHTLYVWDKIILANTKAKNVAFFTHTGGGSILTDLAIERQDSFVKLVFGMALCHFGHEESWKHIPKPIGDLFSASSKIWMASDRPLDSESKKTLLFGKKSKRLSAGDKRPEWVAYSCKDSAFNFLRELYEKRQQNK